MKQSVDVTTAIFCLFVCDSIIAEKPTTFLMGDPMGVRMRVRHFTIPSFLVVGFTAAPAALLGSARYALELHYSKVNDFQVEDDQFQFVTGANGVAGASSPDRPGSGGFEDPNLYLRYAVPGNPWGWRFNLAEGIKPPLARTERLPSLNMS